MRKVIQFFLTAIIIQVACSFFISGIWKMMSGSYEQTGEMLITISAVGSLVTIIVFLSLRMMPLTKCFLYHRPCSVSLWTLALAFGLLIPSMLLNDIIPEAWRKDYLSDVFNMILSNPWGYLQIGLLAPVAEEIVFRGAIQSAATEVFCERENRYGHWKAIFLSAMLFAAAHGNPSQFFHAFLTGVLMGWIYWRGGSIIPCIIIHWVNNSTAFLLYYIMPETYDMTVAELFGQSHTLLTVVTAFSTLLFLYALNSLRKVWQETNNETPDKEK